MDESLMSKLLPYNVFSATKLMLFYCFAGINHLPSGW